MLWALQYPALPLTSSPLQQAQYVCQVGVVRRLVVRKVVIAPLWREAQPLEVVGGEIRPHELELFVNVLGVHRVHGCDEWRDLLHADPGLGAAPETRIGRIARRGLSRQWHGLVGFPQRQ